MNPQHSSSAQDDLRWRGSLQAMFCTDYSIMHDKAFNKIGLRQCSSPGTGFLFDKIGPWITDAPIDDPSNLYPVLKVMRVTLQNDSSGCRCGSKHFTPSHKQQIFNRMNGSPGDPPGTHMHKFKPKRITPSTHRLVSDPTSMEAGRETLK